jgi:hypothetical protein
MLQRSSGAIEKQAMNLQSLKIISGGQTGADRAGLDWDIKHGFTRTSLSKGRCLKSKSLPIRSHEPSTRPTDLTSPKRPPSGAGSLCPHFRPLKGLDLRQAAWEISPRLHVTLCRLAEPYEERQLTSLIALYE